MKGKRALRKAPVISDIVCAGLSPWCALSESSLVRINMAPGKSARLRVTGAQMPFCPSSTLRVLEKRRGTS
ncbi:hypothetical protein ACQ86N_33580 [Puia sp. P3]|uniref:hypothetical protein n=1 Tax=Puia sp. P3 TaxID=3423952 RepID=UPI003D6715EE